jgi:hypothetical protein
MGQRQGVTEYEGQGMEMEHHSTTTTTETCDRGGCPYGTTIDDLHRVVFVGNGSPALTVQISNLATKIDTTHKLIVLAMLIIPVLMILFQWGAKAAGFIPVSINTPPTVSQPGVSSIQKPQDAGIPARFEGAHQ